MGKGSRTDQAKKRAGHRPIHSLYYDPPVGVLSNLGRHARNPPRPDRFFVQLDKEDLLMLVIPHELRDHFDGPSERGRILIT